MRALKAVLMTVLFVFAMGMTSCTKSDIAEEDQLYGQEAVDLTKVHRPGSGGN